MKRRTILFICISLLPLIAYANTPTTTNEPSALDTLLFKINALIINPAIATLFIVAFVIFLYGMVEFLYKANDKDGRAVGKQHMIWGVIGFVIMLGVYGIINFLLRTFNIEGPVVTPKQQIFNPPSVPDIIIK